MRLAVRMYLKGFRNVDELPETRFSRNGDIDLAYHPVGAGPLARPETISSP